MVEGKFLRVPKRLQSERQKGQRGHDAALPGKLSEKLPGKTELTEKPIRVARRRRRLYEPLVAMVDAQSNQARLTHCLFAPEFNC